jgi:uncharacterized protein (DUF2141 family)
MRLPLLLALAMAGATPLAASAAETASLTVTFTGLEPRGAVNFVLVNSAEAYGDKAAPVAVDRLAVSGGSVSRTFTGLAPGRYAIKAFHDVNGDGKMGTNPFGIPTEPYGFSNNAKGAMGPPRWDDAGFAVAPGANAQTISVN